MKKPAQHLTIDFDFIADIAHRGIRRASTFLGLGVNAARDCEFKKYQLNEITLFRVMPDKVDDSQIEEFKEHFEQWIVRSALREITESFSVFLDTVNKACLRMAVSKQQVSAEAAPKLERNFDHEGLDDKLKLLREQFAVTTVREKYFSAINQARNCITHRRSIVGEKDLDGDGAFLLHWWKMEMLIETESGKEIPFGSPPRKEPIVMEEPGTVCARITENIKTYKKGDVLTLTPEDLCEIIFLTQMVTSEILRSLIAYAQSIGIEFKVPKIKEAGPKIIESAP
jgi:hypothetical protein